MYRGTTLVEKRPFIPLTPMAQMGNALKGGGSGRGGGLIFDGQGGTASINNKTRKAGGYHPIRPTDPVWRPREPMLAHRLECSCLRKGICTPHAPEIVKLKSPRILELSFL